MVRGSHDPGRNPELINTFRLEVLRALVGHIPPHPLWAELLWQRQEELSKRTVTSTHQGHGPAAQGAAGMES